MAGHRCSIFAESPGWCWNTVDEMGGELLRNSFLINDFVVMEDVCNANCEYCITSGSEFKSKHDIKDVGRIKFHLEKLLQEDNRYRPGMELYKRINKVLGSLYQYTQPKIMKVSGGEIFLIDGIMDMFREHASRYRRIQILTNGLLLNREKIEELATIPNLCLQLSMDGHTLDLNYYRIKSQELQDKICKNLRYACESGIPVEINCVLTDKNVEEIYDFACYLKQFDHVLFLPYPVRSHPQERFFPQKHQLHSLDKLISEYESLKTVLPPSVYLEKLRDYLLYEKYERNCYISSCIYQAFDDGIITPCPNIWFKSLGNILEREEQTVDKILNSNFSKIVQRKQNLLRECSRCFTPWEILNLYFEDQVGIKDLKHIYLYNDEEILAYLEKKKNSLKEKN